MPLNPAPSTDTLRLDDDPSAIDAQAWNTLLARQPAPTPFMRHEYLAALHASGSATERTGWAPRFLSLWRGTELRAACPLYLKTHSYGEYVFDWAWADAYERHGLAYYPKLLCAVPFTPVPGTRLLAHGDAERRLLLRAMTQLAGDADLSSAHLLFAHPTDVAAADEEGWPLRHNVQFHWTNREGAAGPYMDFAEFLASLQREKRKKIQQERRRVAEAGVSFTVHRGEAISTTEWDFFYRCYTRTYRAHHSTPYLTRDFFARMAATMPQHWLLFIAHQGKEPIACSLVAIDDERRQAYGRYWGAVAHVPLLHFEACYYQPLQWCIAQGYRRFEGGAQGEHKMARGLLPARTASAHWLSEPRFANAIAEFLEHEGAGVDAYVDELNERNPFKRGAEPAG
jgi:predicted N-acyltransferase